jgi:[acyl-carrier-protein] S-malonyltransferase
MSSVILFPGQGSQFVGMGKKLLDVQNVRKMFEIANHVFRRDLLKICLEGPAQELSKTINQQPAVFLTSLAAVEKLKQDKPEAVENCIATAGFSIGEYASLVFSGAISFEDALQLIKIRAEFMQKASEAFPTGLMSVFITHKTDLNLAFKAMGEWCLNKLHLSVPVYCGIANYLNADCRVIGANVEALDFLELNYKEFGILRVKRLDVSGAFHTKLMNLRKSRPLLPMLDEIQVNQPLIPCYSNVTGDPYNNSYEIKRLLNEQISKPVKWEQIIHKIYSRKKPEDYIEGHDEVLGFPDSYECGPGRQLGYLIKSVNNKAFKFYKNIEV